MTADQPETQTVVMTGPMRLTAELTDDELERARSGEWPPALLNRGVIEWEPAGSPEDWSVHPVDS